MPKRKTPSQKITTTTIGLPITSKPIDQELLRMLDALKDDHGFRSRTAVLRTLIQEDFNARGLK